MRNVTIEKKRCHINGLIHVTLTQNIGRFGSIANQRVQHGRMPEARAILAILELEIQQCGE